jgi:hypothetical protein
MNWSKPRKAASRARTGIVVTTLATIMIGTGVGGAQASGAAWTAVSSPNATLSGGNIQSVSCSAPDACTAVGTNLDASGINVTLAERWDGTSWARQATPNPPGNTAPSVAPDLLGVSCPAADFCAAVGAYKSPGAGATQVSIAETWNGTSWTWQSFPVPADSDGAGLTGVSCTSPRFCEAVGTYFDTSAATNVTLAATWNGTSWSLQSTPNPGGFNFEQFNTVSCASPTFCEAWASGNAGNPGVTLAEQWDGTSWSSQTVPSNATVNSVSCVSATFCEAVGPDQAFAWDGSAWSAQTIPAPADNGNLSGVSCASLKFCEAVGEYNNNGNDVGVAVEWDGSAWSAQTTPSPSTATWTNMNAVSCASAKSCEAGGYFEVQVTSNDPKALADTWTGKAWQLQQAAAPPGATYNSLSAVSCVSAGFCEAVGTHFNSAGNEVNLAETWNGKSWLIQATPNPQSTSGGGNSLSGVSCVSTDFCEALGAGAAGATTETWNGTVWQVQTRPGAEDTSTQVVSCVSVSFCLSSDGFGNVDIWNGSSWSAGPSVTGFSGTGFSAVSSLSCVSASFCVVVGEGPSGDNAAVWNGTSWTDQSTPGPASAALIAVSCTSASSCEAVGQNVGSNGQLVTLAESWDGSAWTTQTTPNPTATQGSSLSAVSCTSATSCTAVGQYQSSNVSNFGDFQTLAEVWDGTTWSLPSTPNPSVTHDLLLGVSCGASQTCTAVGQALDPGGVEATLIETGD